MDETAVNDIFEAEAAKAASPSAMKTASEIAMRMAALEIRKGKGETYLAQINNELQHLKTKLVPEAMAAAGQSSFTISGGEFDGVGVTVDNFVSGSLPKTEPEKSQAVAWLEANDGGPLVKNQVVIDLPKGSNKIAMLLEWLDENDFEYIRTTGVHPMSLAAFGRERLRSGKPLDETKIGLFIGRAAKLIWPNRS